LGYGGTTDKNMTAALAQRPCEHPQGTKARRRKQIYQVTLELRGGQSSCGIGIIIRPDDIMIDDLNRRYVCVISGIERFGWRMTAAAGAH